MGASALASAAKPLAHRARKSCPRAPIDFLVLRGRNQGRRGDERAKRGRALDPTPPMKKLLAATAVSVVALGAAAVWWVTRTEPIPEQLEALEAEPTSVVIPGMGDQRALDLEALKGKTAAFVVIGTWSAKSPEGEETNRAMSRWTYPSDTEVYIVADAAGLSVFSDRIEATLGSYAAEVRFPLYVDYQGTFINTFKLPKGHHGLVVLDPEGRVITRHSGGLEGAALTELREQLGASEPQLGPAIPEFELDGFDIDACSTTACAFVYTGSGSIARSDIPRIGEGQFEGDEDALLAQMLVPSVRNVTLARKMKLPAPRGVLLGDIADDIDTPGWVRVTLEEGADARRALGLGDAAAIVAFDGGREAIRTEGLAPLFVWGRLADLLEVKKFNDRRPPRG